MDEDSRPLLDPPTTGESGPGIKRNPSDLTDPRTRRPFYIEPTNIVSVNYDTEEDLQQVSSHASAMNKRIHYYNRLSNRSTTALIAPNHVIPAQEEIYIYSPLGTAFKIVDCADGAGKNSSIVTIFMIWNTMMGTSILSIPWGIKQAGFMTGICILVLMALLTLYCCYRVVKSRATIPLLDTSSWEFPDVCKYYFGSFGQWSSLLFSMVSLAGATIVYWVLMSNFLFNTGKFIYNYVHDINITETVLSSNGSDKVICPNPHNSDHGNNTLESYFANNTGDLQQFELWWSKTRTVPVYLIVVLLPLLNFKSPAFFAKFNVLGTVSVIYLVGLVTLKVVHLGFHLDFHWDWVPEYDIQEFRWSFPQFTGVLTLAFFIHNCVITLLKNNRNPENNVRDLSIAYILVGLTYTYVGIMIFAAFPAPLSKDCIEQNFLDNFPSSDILSFIARIFLLFQMMTVYPLLGYLIRVQLLGHIFGKVYPSFFHVLFLNLAVVGCGVVMAEFYPNIGGIIRYSGATCGLAFVFVYPCLIHMIASYRTGQLTWPSLIFHVFIMALGLANLVAQFFM